MTDEGRYYCPYCGEEVVIPVDPSQGDRQEYVEDCPVCCSPVTLKLSFFDDEVHIDAEAEE